jgi:hypothetical protein
VLSSAIRFLLPSPKHRNAATAQPDRLRALQEPLEALMLEARILRARLELLLTAQQLAVRELSLARRSTRPPSLARANRVF